MSRNPHATNLRHHRPKRIEDKRPNAETLAAMQEIREGNLQRFATVDELFDELEARECPTGTSAT